MLGNKISIKAGGFHPLKENVFVCDLDSGPTVTAGGIIRPDDNMSNTGIRSRWGRVWAIGPDVKDLEVGEWVYIEHARWTNAIDFELPTGKVRVWKIDWPDGVMLASPDDPRERQLTDLPNVQNLKSYKKGHSVAPAIIRSRN
jgi:hypothetical protein